MRTHALQTAVLSLAVSSLTLTGCEPPRDQQTPPNPALAEFVVKKLPDEAKTTRIDIGGKVHLVGYTMDPAASVIPGGSIDVKLYWRRVARIDSQWQLFTELLSPTGGFSRGKTSVQSSFRQAGASPASWKLGQLYEETVTLKVPLKVGYHEVAIGVGLARPVESKTEYDKQPAEVRMQIIGGRSNSQNMGIVTYVSTGLPKVLVGSARKRLKANEKQNEAPKQP